MHKNFRFRVERTGERIYTAIPNEESYEVVWENCGNKGVFYPHEEVERYVKEGFWVVVDNDVDELINRFSYHAPKPGQPEKYESIRARLREVAQYIEDVTPDCREREEAIKKLEEAMFWANASIARREN